VSPILASIAAAVGYLAGSIPFALAVVRVFGGGKPLQTAVFPIPGTGEILRSDAVSATAVRLQLGARYGCLTGILDILKAAVVTLAFKLAYPGELYYLIVSGFAVVGHIWPIFNRFHGGRGQSPAIGGLFVVDWPTPLIAYPLAQILGLASRSRAYVGRFAPMVIAAGWLYFRFRDVSFVYYGIGLCAVRVIAMRDEIKQYARFKRAGGLRTLTDELEFLSFGARFSSIVDRIRQLGARFNKNRQGS
jgi:glycerol-3-phosphate acyltransferase PlsY